MRQRRAEKRRKKAQKIAKVGLMSGAALGMSHTDVMATIIDLSGMPVNLVWGTTGMSMSNVNLDGSGNMMDFKIQGSVMMNLGRAALVDPGMSTTVNVLTTGGGFILPVALGASIGASPYSSFVTVSGMAGIPFLEVNYDNMAMTYTTNGSFNISSSLYFGFQFDHMGTLVNAWGLIHISGIVGGYPTGLEFTDGAFEDSGAPIAAGQDAPEPGTAGLMLLGLGALGVMGMRNRKKQREAASASAPSE